MNESDYDFDDPSQFEPGFEEDSGLPANEMIAMRNLADRMAEADRDRDRDTSEPLGEAAAIERIREFFAEQDEEDRIADEDDTDPEEREKYALARLTERLDELDPDWRLESG